MKFSRLLCAAIVLGWMTLTAGTLVRAEAYPEGVAGVADLRHQKVDGKSLATALNGRNVSVIVLPAGTITLSGPIDIADALVGQGRGKTILRITPGMAKKALPGSPKYGIRLQPGARLEGVTLEITGPAENATGVSLGNGSSLIDSEVKGGTDLDVGVRVSEGASDEDEAPTHVRAYIQDVQIEGFNVGIGASGSACILTAERLSLSGQKNVGAEFNGACGALRKLSVTGSAAVDIRPGGVVAIDSATCNSGAAPTTRPAIVNEGAVQIRNLKAIGFASGVTGGPAGPELARFDAPRPKAPVSAAPLEVADVPDAFVPSDQDWANGASGKTEEFTVMGWGKPGIMNNEIPAIQQIAGTGKPAIYLPSAAAHPLFGQLKLPGSLRLLDGMRGMAHQVYHGSGPMYTASIEIADDGAPLEIRDFRFDLANVTILHTGKRALVLRRVSGFKYVAKPGAGTLFLVDCSPESLVLAEKQSCWARSLNMISSRETLVTDKGGSFWALGFCSSRWQTLVQGEMGSTIEIVGGLAVARSWRPKEPMFKLSNEGHLSAFLGEQPGSPIAYERLLTDEAGKVLIRRNDLPLRSAGSEDRAAGSSIRIQR